MADTQCCRCVHGTDVDVNSIGERIVYCELRAEWMNVTLGDCLGKCESEENQPQEKEFSIIIRETLETQVTVEAENEEAALREVEHRWKNGEYILDADNFQGVDFRMVDLPPIK